MALNPIITSDDILDKYLRYIETTFYIDDKEYMQKFKEYLNKKELFAKGPYLDFSDSFKSGKSIDELIDEGILSKEFRKLYKGDNQSLLSRKLYIHQEASIRKIYEERNVVVTTGTGSGKTEAFLIPIINYLMKQKEEYGKITPGVRALIIYPMNALANDQMKRMRELLVDYPDITFGAYTGETETKYKNAYTKYLSLNDGDIPIPNEKISRDGMKDEPPQILITNYAMLEYLLLRPKDNVFFNGEYSNQWKYIVLDEAHTYNGATGIEVSLLLRRLRNSLSTKTSIKFILTSATLGDEKSNQDICDFASNLCTGSKFDSLSIVRATRFTDFNSDNCVTYPSEIYNELSNILNQDDSVDNTLQLIHKYNKSFIPISKKISELLYEVISKDALYYEMRDILKSGPITINELSENLDIDQKDIVSFVKVARKAYKNNIHLLDARYHMFIRALEGVYTTLGAKKELFLTPRENCTIDEEIYKVFKITVCRYCGKIYIEGVIKNSQFEQSQENERKNKNLHFMLLDKDDDISKLYVDIDDDDDYEIYKLCGKCGHIENASLVHSKMCDCGIENQVMVLGIHKTSLHKCYACGKQNSNGTIIRAFYLSQEAAASVICSSLYENIPSQKVTTVEITHNNNGGFFGFSTDDGNTSTQSTSRDKINKQLLVFSDSRQEAAYFTSYFDITYNNMLKRRLLIEALNQLQSYSSNKKTFSIKKVVSKLSALLEQFQIVEPDDAKKEAWKVILAEISNTKRNGLENVGLISFEFNLKCNLNKIGDFKENEVLPLLRVLLDAFKTYCIYDFPLKDEMLEEDRKFYTYNGFEYTIAKNKVKGNNYAIAWIPDAKTNSRFDYLKKTLKTDDHSTLVKYLENIWDGLLLKDKYILSPNSRNYLLDIENFTIRPCLKNDFQWFICNKCGKITRNNINNICPTYRCDGELVPCDFEKDFKNNHYRKQYLEMDISSMKIKEHTAQLSPGTAKKYQEMFIKNEINVLSCSTTFEMGVDVGDLETVFMKNMPPSPSNYTQRAGRAGRRNDSVAYSLTFCRLASHDLTYFKSPKKMIKGQIQPPKFKVENEKIVKRHMNSAIIASFWKENPETYKSVLTFFDESNFESMIDYVRNLPEPVRNYVNSIVPDLLKQNIEQWILVLGDKEGILYREYNAYKNEKKELNALRSEAVLKTSKGESLGYQINLIDRYIKKLEDENILSFLSKKNVIPKYGFPVDTVELVTSFDSNKISGQYGGDSKLRLQRDLMIAISEYAPGSEVIADGNIYKSQYIKRPAGKNKEWNLYDFSICKNSKCNHLNIDPHISGNIKTHQVCEMCGEEIQRNNTFIIPEYGFIISPKIEKSSARKPNKTYHSEIYYIGDKNEVATGKDSTVFYFNGKSIKVKSTTNDELVVLNTSTFYVCNLCGYAEVDNRTNGSYIKKVHNNPYGRQCNNDKLQRRTLGHKFKTDVAAISINGYIERNKALSILYAILEGTSHTLGIVRTEISGTLNFNKLGNDNWETVFILFDNVPGGAGHVRRVAQASEDGFRAILQESLNVVEQCTCGGEEGDSACYSCLCNYYNQAHHDIIKRKYAIEFLKLLLI